MDTAAKECHGEASPPEFEIIRPTFGPDSSRVTYFARTTEGWTRNFDQIRKRCVAPHSAPIFSTDSRRIVYWADRNNRIFLVVDGKPYKSYDAVRIESLAISHDSQHITYVTQRHHLWWLVIDGDPYERTPLTFDESHLPPNLVGSTSVTTIGNEVNSLVGFYTGVTDYSKEPASAPSGPNR